MVAFCYHCSMSQPVKVSDALVLDARLMGEVTQRSIAGQIEFWALVGRAALDNPDMPVSFVANVTVNPKLPTWDN